MNNKRLTRPKSDRMVAGVAAGIAQYFAIDPTLVRLLFVILTLAGGPGLIAYVVLWIVMPEADYIGSVNGFDHDDVVIKDKEF